MAYRRTDSTSFDLRRLLPRWAARAVGLPGSHAFTEIDDGRLAPIARATENALGYAPFPEQLMAATALLAGRAVEMDTGEGKTLAGAMAAIAFARDGRRVHVLSVNDYLAHRDAEWMGAMFDALGVSVAWIGQASTPDERRTAYRADVVYAPFSEVGYDVLRDRQAEDEDSRTAPQFDVGIVDEADAVMIDDAMTPLVLAGSDEAAATDFAQATALVANLVSGSDYDVDEDRANVTLTGTGIDAVEEATGIEGLFDESNTSFLTRINLALHARVLVLRDVDYLVTDEGIRLINTARGRIAHRQRWPDGLHAAVEAKEGLPITPPGLVLDQITVQDLLKSYETLSGMSGTILPVADELQEFYELESGRVERHVKNARYDHPLRAFATHDEKIAAVVAEIERRARRGQPVLVGTQSVAASEELASALPASLAPRVLNARHDADEAAIIARAGEVGAVTISTQMSGRGTDIRLGGRDERDRERVVAAGGLAVIATDLYPSARLDLQLRGRAGRQGDPGETLTFASLEDELVRANRTDTSARVIAAGSVDERTRLRIVREAQSIAESVRLDRHKSAWQYTRAITRQRDKVLRVRDEAMREPDPRRRAITLFTLDEHWQRHLEALSELRDGIHLRRLAGQNPVDEFHRTALREFDGFFDAVEADVTDRLERAGTGEDLGLRRPSATWTYMLRDDPFGDRMGRAAAALRRWIRREADER
ncbi:MAG TPA: accessory Sec system translocase SecA2 [Candidatus Microbacterium pullistercoris]|nr:accessory Sec system translocase SecA2 [Candidatus Microbacterium pullistercoris]